MSTKIVLSAAIVTASLISLHPAAQAQDKQIMAQDHRSKTAVTSMNVLQSGRKTTRSKLWRNIRASQRLSGRRIRGTKGKESLNGIQLRGTIQSATISINVSQIDSIVLPDGTALSAK